MIRYFNQQWDTVPSVVVDTECTGKRPGYDRAVSFGLARFEKGVFVAGLERIVNPGMPIPAEATAIHGITDEMAAAAPALAEAFADPEVQALLKDAQPAAYNGGFDRHFVPPFGDDWSWPWLDALSAIRSVDRYAKGQGRHRLEPSCARHGVQLLKAHSAFADARAAGELLYKVGPDFYGNTTLGEALRMQAMSEAEERHRFLSWLSRQPPREAGAA
jgi:DNA polymerase-3 subunit epsilon